MENEFFKKYKINPNREQTEAIGHIAGPALVLAGPGSGKTTVITTRCARLVHLMEQKQLESQGILTVAFNRFAAAEMEERYKKVFNNFKIKGVNVDFSTFHSFCNRVIYRYESLKNTEYKRIPEKGEVSRESILSDLYQKINGIRLTNTEANKLSNEIGKMKNSVASDILRSMSNFKQMDRVFDEYENLKSEKMYIDFDDMLINARDIFQTESTILKEFQRKYKYIQVDEGQDLSVVQLDILKLLGENIFIVGDDDQGIYSFRGAKAESIVHIEKYFSNCRIYSLKENYRSTEEIIDGSDRFIRQNTVRFEKEFVTNKGKGKKPQYRVFADDEELMAFICAKVSKKSSGRCGILYRNGASSVLPAIMCLKNNISFSISGGRGVFFDSFVSRDILDMLKGCDRKGFFKRRPSSTLRDFISDGFMEEVHEKCERFSLRFEDMLRYICAWEYLLKGLKNSEAAVRLFEELKSGTFDNSNAKVQLSTIHSAKGLEYDTVFIIDLYKGEFPKNCDEEELCEERRLFYVGMTRAKNELYMMYPQKRWKIKLEPSEFIKV